IVWRHFEIDSVHRGDAIAFLDASLLRRTVGGDARDEKPQRVARARRARGADADHGPWLIVVDAERADRGSGIDARSLGVRGDRCQKESRDGEKAESHTTSGAK